MSTLKVNKLRDTAGSADAITLDPNGGAVLAGVTTVTSVKVGAAVTITESGIEATGVGITVANINGGQIGGRRNLIINGAMEVAQRGTSSTTDGFATLDRFKTSSTGTDESPTQEQADVASGTTPYTSGFRKCFKLTNGNQTSGAGASDRMEIQYMLEAQDVAKSGWNYTSASSFITLSFWLKSSVAQAFFVRLQTQDGTQYRYKTSTGSLSADTWTKITKTIPGNSNLQFNNDNGAGLRLSFYAFAGTGYSDSSATDTWAANETGNRTSDMTSTWYTTNDATLELTGVQLEVGSQATAFEHRSYGEELRLCERYCETIFQGESNGAYMNNSVAYGTNQMYSIIRFRTPKRATDPTLVQSTGTDYYVLYRAGGSVTATGFTAANWQNTHGSAIYNTMTCTSGDAGLLGSNNANALVLFTSEI